MIQSVTKMYDLAENLFVYKIVYQDGTECFVPLDEGNRHYKEVLQWVADGNEIGEPE